MFYHPMYRNIRYTDGVQFVHKHAGWVITDMLAVLTHHKNVKSQDFVCVKVNVTKDRRAIMTYEDGDCKVLYRQEYDATDLSVNEIKFFYTDGVLMLASEY